MPCGVVKHAPAAERAGFTLLEALAALAVAGVMLMTLLTAQGLVLKAEMRAVAEPPLRHAGYLVWRRKLLPETPDRHQGLSLPDVTLQVQSIEDRSTGTQWRLWTLASAELPERRMTIVLAREDTALFSYGAGSD